MQQWVSSRISTNFINLNINFLGAFDVNFLPYKQDCDGIVSIKVFDESKYINMAHNLSKSSWLSQDQMSRNLNSAAQIEKLSQSEFLNISPAGFQFVKSIENLVSFRIGNDDSDHKMTKENTCSMVEAVTWLSRCVILKKLRHSGIINRDRRIAEKIRLEINQHQEKKNEKKKLLKNG